MTGKRDEKLAISRAQDLLGLNSPRTTKRAATEEGANGGFSAITVPDNETPRYEDFVGWFDVLAEHENIGLKPGRD